MARRTSKAIRTESAQTVNGFQLLGALMGNTEMQEHVKEVADVTTDKGFLKALISGDETLNSTRGEVYAKALKRYFPGAVTKENAKKAYSAVFKAIKAEGLWPMNGEEKVSIKEFKFANRFRTWVNDQYGKAKASGVKRTEVEKAIIMLGKLVGVNNLDIEDTTLADLVNMLVGKNSSLKAHFPAISR